MAMWFCGLSAVTWSSRTIYAFARDNGLPGSAAWRRVSAKYRTPSAAVWLSILVAMVATISGGAYAVVTSISVIGLYFSYIIPVYLAWRARGTAAEPPRGPWHLGRYGWSINLVAVLWVIVITVILCIPDNMRAGKTMAGLTLFLSVWYSDPGATPVPRACVGVSADRRLRPRGHRACRDFRRRMVSATSTGRKGSLTLDQLREQVTKGEIATVIVGFTDHYGRLMGKRYAADMFVEETAAHGTHGCDYLLTTDMEMEPVPGYRFASWDQGYGDFHLVPDLEHPGRCKLAGEDRPGAL